MKRTYVKPEVLEHNDLVFETIISDASDPAKPCPICGLDKFGPPGTVQNPNRADYGKTCPAERHTGNGNGNGNDGSGNGNGHGQQ